MSQSACMVPIFVILGAVLAYMLLRKNGGPNVMYIKNGLVEDKYSSLVEVLGKPNTIEKDGQNNMVSATWQSPLDQFNDFGKYGGCDMIKLHGTPSKKFHPHPANICGKMAVPEHLLGLKHASENVEQLFVPKRYSQHYYTVRNKLL